MRFLLTALLCCLPLAAHADTYQQFDLNATFADGATIAGSVDIDLDTTPSYGLFAQIANLTYTLNGTPTTITGNNEGVGWGSSLPETQLNFDFGAYGTALLLDLPTTTGATLAGFSGGLCLDSCPIAFQTSIVSGVNRSITFNYATDGTFVADGSPFTIITPEPASLLLLGTAALGLLGWRRSIA